MTEKTPLLPPAIGSSHSSPKTINYLAYGSNLTSAVITDSRHIHPLEITPVRVPSLTLTFTLAGLPYLEPCFANVRPRRLPSPPPLAQQEKELVGVIYKLTEEDYSRLFASEGAGSGYQEFTVTCYPLTPAAATDSNEIIATTLLCREGTSAGAMTRTSCQPSHRYLQLLREGARERGLPASYVQHLDELRGYTITSRRQFVGGIVIMAVWGPVLTLVLLLNRILGRWEGGGGGGGRAPEWVLAFGRGVMSTMWGCYERVLVKVFGDGECTEGEEPNWITSTAGRAEVEKNGGGGGAEVEALEVGGVEV